VSEADHNLVIARDHAELADVAGRIRDAIDNAQIAELRHLFLRLTGLYEAHFRREEKIMARVGYPGLAKHRQAHRELADTLERIHQVLTMENLPGVSRAVAEHIEATLQHTIEIDRQFLLFAERA
jgi:hemerythrin-like metal-binding protein